MMTAAWVRPAASTLVGDVGQGAPQDELAGLGHLGADDDRAVGPVVRAQLVGQSSGVADGQVEDEGRIGRGEGRERLPGASSSSPSARG